jgi:two-component system chemotaxis sensor kinase CheA
MQSNTVILDEIRDWAGQAAGELMLLGPSDLQGLARLVKSLQQKASECAVAENGEEVRAYADSLLNASRVLKSIILNEAPDRDAALETVGGVLDQGQSLGLHPARGNSGKQSPAVSQDTVADTPSAAATKVEYAPWVDDEIVSAYVEQQVAVLPEMEQQILAYESQPDPTLVSSLRRTIHTLKGESGVVGAMSVEKVCHRLEDYLDASTSAMATDVLLATIDWIGNAVRSFGTRGEQVDPGPVLALFEGNDRSQTVRDESEGEAAGPTTPTVIIPTEAPVSRAPATTVPISDRDLANDFVTESQEHFEAADENLLILEKDPANTESIGAVFRAFHTIKGVAGFLGLSPVGDLAHAAETLLDDIRKGKRTFEGGAVEATFNALDLLKIMIGDLHSALEKNTDFPVRHELASVITALRVITENQKPPVAGDAMVPESASEPVPELAPVPPRVVASVASDGATGAMETGGSVKEPANAAASAAQKDRDSGGTMKVEASRIDLLLDTIGELVIAEAIVAGDPEIQAIKSLRLEKNLALLGKITRSLQDMGMSMRLVPVDPVFRKMARLVRDLSHKSGKKVDLKIEGGETEIDKSMVDKLGDPLVHMIRNSMDHGIEPPEERLAAGKSEAGHVVLRAYHKGGSIQIDIEDDGRGLNREAIVNKAIERNLIRSGEGMSDQDIYALIFEPGFSTAAKITEISGRGVGMDVVKRNIESLRGNVIIRSTLGQGTVFTLALPLTTAIIDGMLARVGSEIFILPTLSVLESFRPLDDQIHPAGGSGEVVSFRGMLLPIYRLSRILNVPDAQHDPRQAIIMVIEEFGKYWGLMVDELIGQQQVVIKSIGDGVGVVPGIAGASILADGRPGLILDTAGIIRLVS